MKTQWIQNGRWVSALLCLFLLSVSANANAQSEADETILQPPPSVEEFSLPPGPSTSAPQPAPPGPVDENASPAIEPPAAVPVEADMQEPENAGNPVGQQSPTATTPEARAQPNRTRSPQTPTAPAIPEPRQTIPETGRQPEQANPETQLDSEGGDTGGIYRINIRHNPLIGRRHPVPRRLILPAPQRKNRWIGPCYYWPLLSWCF